MITGKVKWFNERKGYGFITRNDGEKDCFVHKSDVQINEFRTFSENQEVEFELGEGAKGAKAINVKLV